MLDLWQMYSDIRTGKVAQELLYATGCEFGHPMVLSACGRRHRCHLGYGCIHTCHPDDAYYQAPEEETSPAVNQNECL